MRERDFPFTPHNYELAVEKLTDCDCYEVLSKDGEFKGAVVFGNIGKDCAFIDAVSSKKYEGRLFTKKDFLRIKEIAFKDMGLNYIWCNTIGRNSAKIAVKAGFKYVHTVDNENPCYVLTSN